jgi:hypothetical protein
VEHHWRSLLQNSLGLSHVMLVENPLPMGANPSDLKYMLI